MNFPQAAEGRFPLGSEADSYSRWVRTAMKTTPNWPDAAVLFDSTMREPTELLMGVVREAFSGGITDRYQSVFAEGNRFVMGHVAARHGVAPEQVIGTTGATSALALTLKALVSPGDEVLIERPRFDLLTALARDAGAVVRDLPRRAPDYAVDPDEVASLITPNTRLVVLTQLHNPSGAVLTSKTLERLAAVAARKRTPILVDEVYADFVEGAPYAAQLSPDFISVGSLTKVQGLFALKCGWAVASPEMAVRINAATPQGDYGVSKLSHAVAALVLEQREAFDAHWKGLLDAARPVVAGHARRMAADGLIEGAVPDHGCMYFPRIVGVDDTRALCDWLWAEHGVVIAAGEFFGQAGHARIGFGSGRPQALDGALERLGAALKAYPGRR